MPAVVAVASVLLAFGCATPPADVAFAEVQKSVSGRTGHRLVWHRAAAEDAETAQAVQALLDRPLTAENAVQVALLRNRDLQATFEGIGIAQADLLQASRLTNPGISAAAQFGTSAGVGSRYDVSVTQSFLEAISLALRRRLAARELAAVQWRVADAVMSMASEVKTAVYELQAAEPSLPLLQAMSETGERAAELATMQRQAGNISDLELFTRRAAAAESRLAVSKAQRDVRVQREGLGHLLGVDAREAAWTLAELPALPDTAVTADELETLALRQRYDLLAAQLECESRAEALGLTRRYRYLGGLEFGAAGERDTGGEKLVGPTVSVQVPVFDQGQARLARAEAMLRESEKRLAAQTAAARSEVRQAWGRLAAARDLVIAYRDGLLPEHQRLLREAQLHYNGMFLSAYTLLDARRKALDVEREGLNALSEFWAARAALERAVGGSLGGEAAPSAGSPAAAEGTAGR
jgi:cobalt-zinc-cadmium efflux system outer membrane protein